MSTIQCFALVESDNEVNPSLTLITQQNIKTITAATASKGIYTIEFSKTFSNAPVVSVTSIFSGYTTAGAPYLNPIKSSSGTSFSSLDNANVVYVDTTQCQILLGDSAGNPQYRSFSIHVIGIPSSS